MSSLVRVFAFPHALQRVGLTSFTRACLHCVRGVAGHGSGKLLCQAEDGTLNFDQAATVDPTTGQPVAGFYKARGQTDTRTSKQASMCMHACMQTGSKRRPFGNASTHERRETGRGDVGLQVPRLRLLLRGVPRRVRGHLPLHQPAGPRHLWARRSVGSLFLRSWCVFIR